MFKKEVNLGQLLSIASGIVATVIGIFVSFSIQVAEINKDITKLESDIIENTQEIEENDNKISKKLDDITKILTDIRINVAKYSVEEEAE